MKFILSESGNKVINLAFIKDFAIERVVYQDGGSTESHVIAELEDDSDVTIKIFDSGNEEENFYAARIYLAELVDKLNGGAKL